MDAMSTREMKASALKARDVVRLIHEAAKLSMESGEQPLLDWDAIRDALDVVGVAKVSDLAQQAPELSEALERVRALAGTHTVPFHYWELADDQDKLALLMLEEERIAFKERDEVWLVPLYRRGLGLRLAPRRRERVLR